MVEMKPISHQQRTRGATDAGRRRHDNGEGYSAATAIFGT